MLNESIPREKYIEFFKKFLNVTQEPIRAAICVLATNKYIFEKMPLLEKRNTTPNINLDEVIQKYTLSAKEITEKLQLRGVTAAHHHIKRLVEENILVVALQSQDRYLYELSDDAQQILSTYQFRFTEDSEFQRLGFLVTLTAMIGQVKITKTQIENLGNSAADNEKFYSWLRDEDVVVRYFITSIEARKLFRAAFDETIKNRGGFRHGAPGPAERTFVGFLLLPPWSR